VANPSGETELTGSAFFSLASTSTAKPRFKETAPYLRASLKEPPVSDIDPQEFGELRAQVRMLLESNRLNAETLATMSTTLQTMQLQMAEAKGGWKLLMLLGGSAATLGSAATWALTHFTGKGAP
jgi:hypothetical protein